MNFPPEVDPPKKSGRAQSSRPLEPAGGFAARPPGFRLQAGKCRFNYRTARHLLPVLFLAWAGCAHESRVVPTIAAVPEKIAPPPTAVRAPATTPKDPEQIRMNCIAGRRVICGRVLKVLPDGLVVDSGYTDLLRPPLTQSWVVPGNVSARRDPALLERNEPGTPCVGVAFLTDFSKRKKVKKFDYVILIGYPAGQYVYAPAPNVKKTFANFPPALKPPCGSVSRRRKKTRKPTPRKSKLRRPNLNVRGTSPPPRCAN